jgi:hypothetical protein
VRLGAAKRVRGGERIERPTSNVQRSTSNEKKGGRRFKGRGAEGRAGERTNVERPIKNRGQGFEDPRGRVKSGGKELNVQHPTSNAQRRMKKKGARVQGFEGPREGRGKIERRTPNEEQGPRIRGSKGSSEERGKKIECPTSNVQRSTSNENKGVEGKRKNRMPNSDARWRIGNAFQQ